MSKYGYHRTLGRSGHPCSEKIRRYGGVVYDRRCGQASRLDPRAHRVFTRLAGTLLMSNINCGTHGPPSGRRKPCSQRSSGPKISSSSSTGHPRAHCAGCSACSALAHSRGMTVAPRTLNELSDQGIEVLIWSHHALRGLASAIIASQ